MKFLDILLLAGVLISFYFYLKPFVRKFYYTYIDKSPITLTINGKLYHIDRKSKKFVVEQMDEQDKAYELNKKDNKNEQL